MNSPIAFSLAASGFDLRKFSSLQDLMGVATNSELVAKILRLSSVKLTPPMVATSLMSSSSLKYTNKQQPYQALEKKQVKSNKLLKPDYFFGCDRL